MTLHRLPSGKAAGYKSPAEIELDEENAKKNIGSFEYNGEILSRRFERLLAQRKVRDDEGYQSDEVQEQKMNRLVSPMMLEKTFEVVCLARIAPASHPSPLDLLSTTLPSSSISPLSTTLYSF